MMGGRVVISEIICIVIDNLVPEKMKCSYASILRNQQKHTSHDLDRFLWMERVEQLLKVELYVFKGVLF